MIYQYNINETHKDTTSSKMLLVCHILSGIIVTFVSTFLVAYMYTPEIFVYIKRIALYYLTTYIVMTLASPLFSMLVEKTNRVWIFRLGIFLRTALVVLLIFRGEEIAKIIPLAGLLYGFSSACYYSAYNIIRQEMVSRHKNSTFETVLTSVQKTVNILIPITLGALIEISTYIQTAIYVFVIGVITLFFSFFIKAHRPVGSGFSVRKFFSALKTTPAFSKKIKYMYYSALVAGSATILAQLIYICIMINFQSSFSLGWITSLASALSIVEILLIAKFTKDSKRSWVYIILALTPLLTSFLYVFTQTKITLIIFYIATALCNAFYGYKFEVFRNGTLKDAGYYDFIAEHQTIIDVCMCFVRATTYCILFLSALLEIEQLFYILLIIFTISYTAITFMLMAFENKYTKPQCETNQNQNEHGDLDNAQASTHNIAKIER